MSVADENSVFRTLDIDMDGGKENYLYSPYCPNEYYTEEEWRRRLKKSLENKLNALTTACNMLSDVIRDKNFYSLAYSLDDNERTDYSIKPELEASITISRAFKSAVMKYIFNIDPEWMDGVSYIDTNYSGGILDVWKYDKTDKLLDSESYKIDFNEDM